MAGIYESVAARAPRDLIGNPIRNYMRTQYTPAGTAPTVTPASPPPVRRSAPGMDSAFRALAANPPQITPPDYSSLIDFGVPDDFNVDYSDLVRQFPAMDWDAILGNKQSFNPGGQASHVGGAPSVPSPQPRQDVSQPGAPRSEGRYEVLLNPNSGMLSSGMPKQQVYYTPPEPQGRARIGDLLAAIRSGDRVAQADAWSRLSQSDKLKAGRQGYRPSNMTSAGFDLGKTNLGNVSNFSHDQLKKMGLTQKAPAIKAPYGYSDTGKPLVAPRGSGRNPAHLWT